jgi:hypothetical protein
MSEITAQRPATARWSPAEIAVALVGLVWVALAAFWAAPGVYTDGFIYQAMIDAFAHHGSLFVENGFEQYRADPLRLTIMRDAGGRLAPQYPGGWAILAAPAYLAGGLRGVILVNAVASALTLPLVWAAARALFEDRRLATRAALIYGLATFAVDYAFGVWPHGVTTFLVTAAVAAAAAGWRRGGAAELRGALAAGLALGLGVNIRVDALIAAAPIAVWLLGAGRRPYAALGLLLAGLLPGLAAAAAINQAKFGVFSPVTYGTSQGATSLGYYAQLAPLAAAAAVAALGLGIGRVRAALYRPPGLAVAGVAAFALALALPGSREALIRIAEGFWVLVVDFQAYPAPARGLTEMPDGTIRMYGITKKALLQSLPYAAAVLVLAPRLWRGPDRAATAFCALFVLLGILPFAFGSWHGGMGNNMRYFLNVMPVLAILSAVALRQVAMLSGERGIVSVAAALCVGSAALIYAGVQGYSWEFALSNTLPNAVAGTAATLAITVLLADGALRRSIATMLRGVAALGLMTAFILGWVIDVQFKNLVRARNAELATLAAELPGNALVTAFTAETAGLRVNRPPALTAQANPDTLDVDPPLAALITRAFSEGRPVFAQGRLLADQLVAKGIAGGSVPRFGIDEQFEFYEMAPPAGGAGPMQ